MDLMRLTAHELKEGIVRGETSSYEVVNSLFDRIEKIDRDINAYISLLKEEALRKAEEVDRRIDRGEKVGKLAGIPLAVKDNICVRGTKTTCGSKILENFVSPYDATVIERLKSADAVIIGKTNMDEFAMGSSTETSYFGVTRNPYDLSRVPGGSSGGSAAAVASGETVLALGSDTGGSIRQPASFCGVVGLKPTYGRVSRFGLVAYASSLDQIGPLTKDVTDCALLLGVLAGHDLRDSTSGDLEVPDYLALLQEGVKGIRLGIPEEYFAEGLDPEVNSSVMHLVQQLADLGAEVENASLPHTGYAIASYYLLATAEASANLARYDGVKYGFRAEEAADLDDMYCYTRSIGFGDEVKRRIMLGTYALSAGYYEAYYRKAQKVRTLIKQDFQKAFERFDVLITPTSPTVAFKIGEKLDDPLKMYLSDVYTISVNLAGIPAVSVPCGISAEGLPIGLQILGRHFDEATVLRVAYAVEQVVGGAIDGL
ncbi:MAG TPA: Asp-tRNA(Asn)/Glu-tRNA(Gln) amidotransferase subunit GatA [Candidatus Latescibacteria bacterium]|nr:Asp-tRNA(Asn)/Glu-tRNA(Gln) amidotransferase subunit GatA [Candidatus Latescibacterota bacterium]